MNFSVSAGGALGPFFALLSSLTWAIGSARYSLLSHSHSAFTINFGRALFALPLFLVATFIVAGGWHAGLHAFSAVRSDQIGWLALSMIASYGLGDVIFLASTRVIGIPTALAIGSCFPIWTGAAALIFRAEALSPLQYVGLVIAVIGIILVILNSPETGLSTGSRSGAKSNLKWKGLSLAFLTSIMWAVNSYSCAQGGRELAVPVGNTIRMAFALVFSAGFSRWLVPKAGLLLPRKVIYGSIWVFALEAFGGSYFYLYGITHSPLAVGATLSSLSPVMAVPIAWALGLEKFSILRTLAICIVIVGICLLLGGGSG